MGHRRMRIICNDTKMDLLLCISIYSYIVTLYMCMYIIYVQSCDSALVKGDGVQCLNLLTRQIGKMIMRGRIEQHNSR